MLLRNFLGAALLVLLAATSQVSAQAAKQIHPAAATGEISETKWDGIAGTWFWIDPTNDVVFVGIVQRWLLSPGTPDVESLSRALTYQALVNPNK